MPPHARPPAALASLGAGLAACLVLLTLPPRTLPAGSGAATPDGEPPPAYADPAAARAERLEQLGVRAWHARGSTGRGVKVAVLDTGFRGYRAHLGHALPAHVAARAFRADGDLEARDSQHGILCGEVVHALAPDAELLLATWEPDRPEQFLEAVRWARREGARVISCSVIMPSWSDGEGGGDVHAALAAALGPGDGPGDLLCFASAGNTALRHWCGTFHDSGGGGHAWAPGQTENPVTPWGDEPVSVELCARPGACYEVDVEDATYDRVVARGVSTQERPSATARFQPEEGHAYQVRVRLRRGPAGFFHLVTLGGGLGRATPRGSIPFPGDGPEVVAVGAVDEGGRRLAYSSCGPNSPHPKPDLVAPVPFPSLWRGRPFAGTSAAAPQAAALAALVWSAHPGWAPRQVRDALRASARDLGPKGHDCETGYGCVRLP